ncbi:MAG: trypsin-like serine peptidase [Silvanigrellaceae bacterium]
MRKIISLLVFPWVMISCGMEQTLSAPMKIIGENDLKPVVRDGTNLPENLRGLIGAFGMLEVGCTVTHIGDGLILTAGHCVPQDKAPSDACLATTYPKMTVRWNYLEGESNFQTSQCVKLVSSELSQSLDYAILEVDNPPRVKLDVELNQRPGPGSQITTFGYPRKRPLEWSGFCIVAVLPTESFVDVSEEDRKHIFAHQCDTEQGQSGAAILDAKTLEIIGVHHGGIEPWNTATWTPASGVAKAIKIAREKILRR